MFLFFNTVNITICLQLPKQNKFGKQLILELNDKHNYDNMIFSLFLIDSY